MKRSAIPRRPCSHCGLVFRHRRDCVRYRASKPLSRSVPVKRRNAKRKSESPQRLAVMERAGWRCEIEWIAGASFGDGGEYRMDWERCGSVAELQMAHVVRRHLAGSASTDPDVCVAACRRCHDAVDHRSAPATWVGFRVPEAAVTRAMTAIRKAEAARAASGRAVVPIPERSA